MRKVLRLSMVTLSGLIVALSTVAPSQAAVSSGATGGVLTVNGDGANDTISIACVGGNVGVNIADPGTGPASCSSITGIVINGGAGNDALTVDILLAHYTALTSVVLNGDAGDDLLLGSPIADTIDGGDDDDFIVGSDGNDAVGGGAGSDSIQPIGLPTSVTLTDTTLTVPGQGTDSLTSIEQGTVALDTGGTANASGFSGTTYLNGSAGSDVLIGGSGMDNFYPEGDADTMTGNGGDDSFTLNPDAVNDSLAGGPGSDLLIANGSTLTLTDIALSGPGEIDSLAATEWAILSVGTDGFAKASAFTGSTSIFGSDGDEALTGGKGNDLIKGDGGDDTLKGGAGKDRLFGQLGDDIMIGGTAKDVCKGGPGQDTIKSCP